MEDNPLSEKITASLAGRLEAQGPAAEVPIIVRYQRHLAITRRATAGIVPRYQFRLLAASALRATPQQIQTLAADPAVEKIWEDLPVHALLDVSVPHIRVPQVWASGFTGRGVKIAILDTGLDPDHPDFRGRIVNGADFSGEGARDRNGHGTHVAGIAAGAGSRYRGVAPSAGILVGKVLHNDGSGMMSDVIAGLEWAVEQGAQVINLSLGSSGPCDGSDALSETCDLVVAQGIVVCVAAGNDGPWPSTIGSPGCARQVITVGASTDRDGVARFSSRGPTLDGRTKPDILFPGEGIVSCRAANTTLGTPVDDLYTSVSGTSMATPHAAGAAALLLEAEPDLSPADIKARFVKAALDLGLDPNTQGAGRVDVYAAYQNEAAPGPAPQPGCMSSLLQALWRGARSSQ